MKQNPATGSGHGHAPSARDVPGAAPGSVDLAQEAIRLGLPVLACDAMKRPLTARGFKDATVEHGEIRRMFAHEAARLIGVRTGRASGRVVVDVDVKDGAPGMAWFGRHGAELPRTRTHRTASGGLHLVFAAPEHVEIRNSQSRVAPGVDVRGEGCFAIWWPAAGCAVVDHAAPAAMPPWLVQAALPPPPRPPRPYRPAASLHDAAGRLLALVRFVAAAPQGERNARLFWAACRCVEAALRGEMPTGAVAAALEQAALAAGLPQPEARRTITSAFRKAAAA